MNSFYCELRKRFLELCGSRPSISASAVFGSQARTITPADQWSDLDLITFTENPAEFIEDQEWLAALGIVRIGFIEPDIFGCGAALRVLFDRGFDVDFLFFPTKEISRIVSNHEVTGWLNSGCDILYDTDGNLAKLVRATSHERKVTATRPTLAGYKNLIGDFYFHTVWMVKKLLRGEVLIAKTCGDNYMKDILLRMVGWHAASADTFAKSDTQIHGNRFFESWAESWIVQGLSISYAHYDEEDILRSLDSSMRLFSRVAKETAERNHFDYPSEYEEYSRELIDRYLKSRQ